MHRAAQAEHMEVQKRGNHGTLSAQLHNEKSNPPVVSILHVMFSVPVGWATGPLSSDQTHSASRQSGIPARDSLPQRKTETKQLINIWVWKSMEKKQEHLVSYPQKKNLVHVQPQQTEQMLCRWCDFWGIERQKKCLVASSISKFNGEGEGIFKVTACVAWLE